MTPEQRTRKQIERYRQMTPLQRSQIGMEMTDLARVLARTLLSLRHPTWSVEQVDREAKRLFLLEAGLSEAHLERIGLGEPSDDA
ncbi:MAG: hypothetical protein K2R98_23600 [Gemmataceae bacterium]|nr:hypothetical protein [Gemmataceae bacterium]